MNTRTRDVSIEGTDYIGVGLYIGTLIYRSYLYIPVSLYIGVPIYTFIYIGVTLIYDDEINKEMNNRLQQHASHRLQQHASDLCI